MNQNKEKGHDKSTLKWYGMSEYVDVHTGEIISKAEYEREYIKIKTNKKYEVNETYGIIRYTIECERNRQTKLF